MPGSYECSLGGEHGACAACPALCDQAEALLAATTVQEMDEAAKILRKAAASVGRMLTRPLPSGTVLQFDPSLLDPGRRRMELTDLAVDVVTAVDYLVSLLGTSAANSSPLILADETYVGSRHGLSDDSAYDRLVRRRLDARGTAVRLGIRLLGGLDCDVVNRPQRP